jgi:hypothetical protein
MQMKRGHHCHHVQETAWPQCGHHILERGDRVDDVFQQRVAYYGGKLPLERVRERLQDIPLEVRGCPVAWAEKLRMQIGGEKLRGRISVSHDLRNGTTFRDQETA